MRSFLFCLLLLVGLAPRSDAFQRAYRPVGDYVRESPLVFVADISTTGAPSYQTVLTIREVLKNESPHSVGQKLEFPISATMWIVPREAQNAVVVMAPNWDAPAGIRPRPVSEVYQAPAQIAAVRALIGVYQTSGERAQLLALQNLSGQGNESLDEQLLADLGRIRQRENFDIVLESFARLEPANQARLLRLLGTMGDERALPLLIGALDAPRREVWGNAANELIFHFPDAPGVRAALQKLATDAEKRPYVASYLARYDPDFDLAVIKPTTWMRAEAARKSGDVATARTLYFAMIEAKAELDWGTVSASRELVKLDLTPPDKARLRRWLNARLLADKPNYSDAGQALELLRALPDAGNVEALTRYLILPDEGSVFLWEQPARAATFALRELGADARKSATARVVQTLKSRFVPGNNSSSQQATIYGCELAWLADDATWKGIGPQLSADAARQLAALQPLREAATAAGEARALAPLLPDTENRWQNHADLWIIERLGELGAPVGVAPLLAELKRAPYAGRDGAFKRALLAIGGDAARDGALQLLEFPESSQRALGMDVLQALPDFDVRPLLLKILDGEDAFDKTHAIFLLGYVGTPQDVPILAKFADFWTTDLAYQRTAADALVGIRLRYPPAE